jgi:hypothetical protein
MSSLALRGKTGARSPLLDYGVSSRNRESSVKRSCASKPKPRSAALTGEVCQQPGNSSGARPNATIGRLAVDEIAAADGRVARLGGECLL